MNNNTRPEPRLNKLGHVVTKHVKDGADEKLSSQLSASAPRLTAADANRNIAEAFVRTAKKNMDDPEKVFDNLDIYVKLFSETNVGTLERRETRETALRSLREDHVFPRLREAFLKGQDADINDPATYAKSADFGMFIGKTHALVQSARKAEEKLYGKDQYTDYSSTTNVSAAASVPNAVAWGSLSHDNAQSMFLAIDKTLDDPGSLWKNMSVLEDALDSSHGEEAIKFAYESPTMQRLANTWLDMHGADITDRNTYHKIEGPDGYATYREKYAGFTQALNEAFIRTGYNPYPEEH